MPIKKVFEDHDGNELECFINSKGKIYIGIGPSDKDDYMQFGYITLDGQDIKELIKELTQLEKELAEIEASGGVEVEEESEV